MSIRKWRWQPYLLQESGGVIPIFFERVEVPTPTFLERVEVPSIFSLTDGRRYPLSSLREWRWHSSIAKGVEVPSPSPLRVEVVLPHP